jgi:hypothetical protein
MRNTAHGELIFPNTDNGIFSEDAMRTALDWLGYVRAMSFFAFKVPRITQDLTTNTIF